MEIILEIAKIILPVIVTGLFTFFITKYTYNKNRPLDKLEITYNRVYYPIYRLISDKDINENISEVINKSKIYFTKYDKYIDVSTKRLFESLCKCTKEAKQKSIYIHFKDNIYNQSSYLRRRLGYLEPNFIQLYKYSIPSTKSFFRITMEICVIYIAAIASTVTINFTNQIYITITVLIFLIFIGIVILEIIWCILRFLYYKIRK